MRSLENHEIHTISGGLTSSQASYLVVMGAQATVTFAATAAFQMLGATPQGLAIKCILLPVLGIAATAFAYEFHNKVVEPKIFNAT